MNTFLRHPAMAPVGRLFAVEAKMRDWKRALKQVRRYSLWTDSYVIVMPGLAAAARESLVAEVQLDGGGLYVGSEWLVRPRARGAFEHRLLGSEHFVNALPYYQPSARA